MKQIKMILCSFALFLIGSNFLFAGLNDGLVAYFPFDGNANDASSNGLDGTVYGAVLDVDRNGNANSCFKFAGKTNWIKLNIGPSYFAQDFTLALWVKLDDFQCWYPTLVNGDGGYIRLEAAGPVYIGEGHYQKIKFYQFQANPSLVFGLVWSPSTFQTNYWYHLAIVRSGLDFRMYLNGVLSAETTENGSIALSGNYLQVGNDLTFHDSYGHYFHGDLDEIRIYNRALSASEIQTLYLQTEGSPGWLIKTYRNGSPVHGLADADALINVGFVIAATNVAESDMVGFSSGEGTGHFAINNPVPGIPNNVATDNYAVQGTGLLVVPQTGSYTFALNTDDGGRLRIDGANVIVDDVMSPPHDSAYVTVSLVAGLHAIEWTWYNEAGGVNGGGAEGEVFAAPGAFSVFNSNFTLVGDPNGLGVIQSPAPKIALQAQSQTAQAGSNVTFNVTVTGALPLSYQWLFNGNVLSNQTASNLFLSNIQFTNAGGYSVVITNTYGSVTSIIAQLTVFTNLVLTQTNRTPTVAETNFSNPISATQLVAFVNGSFTTNVTLDPSRMTIVLTHGWIIQGTTPADGVQLSWTDIAPLIHNNLVQAPNIVAWDWSAAATTVLPGTAASRTPDQGISLGQALTNALGPNYSQPIHFIGHSLGTLVNAYAANFLQGTNWAKEPVSSTPWPATNMQMTLLDEASAATDITATDIQHFFADIEILIGLNNPLLPQPSYWHPLPRHFVWADNYVAAFGLLHHEAANVILTNGCPTGAPNWGTFISALTDFHGYPINWYAETVQNDGASAMGFRWSFEEGGWFNQAPATNSVYIQAGSGSLWNLTLINWAYGTDLLNQRYGEYVSGFWISVSWTLPTAGEHYGQVVGQSVYAGLNNGWNMVVNLETSSGGGTSQIQNLGARPLGGPVPNGGSANNTPAYAWIPLNVPSNVVSMSFDFMLQGNGNQDSFQVALHGTNILSLETSLIQTNVTLNSGLLNVSQYAGQQVELFLGIVGGTSTNAALTVSNFQFYVTLPPSLQIQLSGTNVVLTWPLSATDYVLQKTDKLTPTNSWTTVTNVPVIVNFQYTVTNQISGSSRFYRLAEISTVAPALQAQVFGSSFVLSWPASAQDFSLQTTTNLADPNSWMTVTDTPAIVNLQCLVTNQISGAARFYRLKK